MSKTNSVWGNASRLSDIKKNLSQENNASRNDIYKRSEYKNDCGVNIDKTDNSVPINSSSPYGKNNSKFNRWCEKYKHELEELNKIFLNGLKGMNIETQLPTQKFNYLLYQKTSNFLKNE
jgi:hypothetical protein